LIVRFGLSQRAPVRSNTIRDLPGVVGRETL